MGEEKMEMTMQKREAIEDVEDEVAVEVVEDEDEETNTINEKNLSSEDQICHLRSIILPQKSKYQNLKQTDNLENFSEKKTKKKYCKLLLRSKLLLISLVKFQTIILRCYSVLL